MRETASPEGAPCVFAWPCPTSRRFSLSPPRQRYGTGCDRTLQGRRELLGRRTDLSLDRFPAAPAVSINPSFPQTKNTWRTSRVRRAPEPDVDSLPARRHSDRPRTSQPTVQPAAKVDNGFSRQLRWQIKSEPRRRKPAGPRSLGRRSASVVAAGPGAGTGVDAGLGRGAAAVS